MQVLRAPPSGPHPLGTSSPGGTDKSHGPRNLVCSLQPTDLGTQTMTQGGRRQTNGINKDSLKKVWVHTKATDLDPHLK